MVKAMINKTQSLLRLSSNN